MKKIVDFLIKEKLIVTLFAIMLMIFGTISVITLNKESVPYVTLDMVMVKTIYPGAAPDDVENLVTIPMEKKIREVNHINKVLSYSMENVSVILVYLDENMNSNKRKKVVDDVEKAVKEVTDLPENVETPVFKEITSEETQAIDIAIIATGNTVVDYKILRQAAKDLRDKLLFVEGVARVDKKGYLDREYLIEVNPQALKNYRIGLNTVIGRLQTRNIDLPGGVLRVGDQELVLRTTGQFKNIADIENTVIFSNDAGFVTRLKDIAKVSDAFEEASVYQRINGQDAIILEVFKKQDADMIKTVDRIKSLLEENKKELKSNVSCIYFNDMSRFVKTRLESLISNAISGFILLLGILVFLLGFRMAAIVSISIPITFMAAFIGMKFGGITFNVISMFAMVMVLGMIVDCSIVVCENTYRHMENGVPRREAVERGLGEVFSSMTVTLLCIITTFAPLLLVAGLVGKFIIAIPLVIIICLAASWLCAWAVMPAYLDMFAKAKVKKTNLLDKGDDKPKQSTYKKFLTLAVRHRYFSVVILCLALVVTLFLAGRYSSFVFMPADAEAILIKAKMPQGTNLEMTRKAMITLEKIVNIYDKNVVEDLGTIIGSEEGSKLDMAPKDAIHKGTIKLILVPSNQRVIGEVEVFNTVKRKIAEAKNNKLLDPRLDIKYEILRLGLPVGSAVNVQIQGQDFNVMRKIAGEYERFLQTIKGVSDIRLDMEDGKEEYRYQINESRAAQVGLSTLAIAQTIHSSFKGAVATTLKKGDEEIDLRVRFPDWARRHTSNLNDVSVANQYGGLIPLSEVTSYKKQKGINQINRKNYKRVIELKANTNESVITSLEINTLLKKKFKEIETRYPGYKVTYAGEQEDTEKSMSSLAGLFLAALFIMYMILAAFFNSLMLPVVIMICVPFSIIGIYLALFLHGNQPMTFMGVLGFFSLAGVIVENTVVLVQFINTLRKQGLSLKEAVIEGGALRFRPILLTSGTTVLGLIPTIYGLGGKDVFVAPLGLAFGYGLVFATIISLIMVPCFYHIAEDLKMNWAKLLSKVGINIDGRLKNFDEE